MGLKWERKVVADEMMTQRESRRENSNGKSEYNVNHMRYLSIYSLLPTLTELKTAGDERRWWKVVYTTWEEDSRRDEGEDEELEEAEGEEVEAEDAAAFNDHPHSAKCRTEGDDDQDDTTDAGVGREWGMRGTSCLLLVLLLLLEEREWEDARLEGKNPSLVLCCPFEWVDDEPVVNRHDLVI